MTQSFQAINPGTIAVANGLIGWWPFDTITNNVNSNFLILDISGQGNHGTAPGGGYGPAIQSGAIAQSFYFGPTSVIYVGSNTSYAFPSSQPWSVSLWVNSNGLSNFEVLVTQIYPDGVTFIGWEVGLYVGGAPYIYLINDYTTANWIWIETANAISNAVWTHIVYTYNGNGDASGMNIYVNGVNYSLNTHANALTGPTYHTYNPAAIGARYGLTASWYVGSMDDVRIYNWALSGANVTSIYNNGIVGKP